LDKVAVPTVLTVLNKVTDSLIVV